MTHLDTKSEYCTHADLHLPALSGLIKRGFPVIKSGGKELVDRQAGDKWLADNYQRRKKQVRRPKDPPDPPAETSEPAQSPPKRKASRDWRLEAEELTRTEAERRLAAAKAERAEMDLAKRRGELLPADEVKRTYAGIGRIYASAREGIPAQLAPLLVGKSDLLEIEQILRRELRLADERVSSEIEARFNTENGD